MVDLEYGLILAAGGGTRMHPLTYYFPKIGLPILDKPLLIHQIDIMEMVGIRKLMIVVSGSEKKQIQSIFEKYGSKNIDYHIIIQDVKGGTGHAVLLAEQFLANKRFLLLLGDEYYNDIESFLYMKKLNNNLILGVVEYDSLSNIQAGCNVHIHENYVSRLVEKPTKHLINGKWCWDGSLVLDASIFPVLNSMQENINVVGEDDICLVKALQNLVDQNNAIAVVKKKCVNINLTYKEDFILANLIEYKKKYGDESLINLLNKIT